MTKKEQILSMKAMGYSNAEIVEAVGTSDTYVCRLCGKNKKRDFVPFTSEQCVYPIWREWFNENRIKRSELIRLMEEVGAYISHAHLLTWMRGTTFPNKKNIDALLKVTGLVYEELFYREGDFD